jgi:diketogulonate reductase-like aldo/keto reductase
MEKTPCPTVELSNGVQMPQMGFGVAMLEPGKALQDAIDTALDAGYRLFDNAPIYGNETAFGESIRNNGVARGEIFISTKLRNSQQKYELALAACADSMKALGVDYLDLYMIHFPCPAYDLYRDAWRALEHLYKEGYVRAIGVSNFQQTHLERIFEMCEIRPMVNELECNPYLSIEELRGFNTEHGIRTEAWFPLGGPATRLSGKAVNGERLLADELLGKLVEKYEKSPAQIALRWEVQSGIIPIPKSSKEHRIRENINIFDFELSLQDMAAVGSLNINQRSGSDPETCNDQF